MEGLILLIVIYFLFQAIVKRAKQTAHNNTGNPAAANAPKASTVRKAQPKQAQPKSQPKGTPRPAMSASAWETSYQPIQPSLTMDTWQTAYTGSLGGTSQEGNVSREGVPSQEGAVSLEGETDWQYRQTTAAAVHYSEQVADDPIPVLPEAWDATALVRAVVANEILAKPTQRWRS